MRVLAVEIAASGQQIGPVSIGLAEVAGALRFRLATGTTDPGDLLRLELGYGNFRLRGGAQTLTRRQP